MQVGRRLLVRTHFCDTWEESLREGARQIPAGFLLISCQTLNCSWLENRAHLGKLFYRFCCLWYWSFISPSNLFSVSESFLKDEGITVQISIQSGALAATQKFPLALIEQDAIFTWCPQVWHRKTECFCSSLPTVFLKYQFKPTLCWESSSGSPFPLSPKPNSSTWLAASSRRCSPTGLISSPQVTHCTDAKAT